MNLITTQAGRQTALAPKPEGTGYTGHDNQQAGIQRHSMGEHFARYQIIMAFAPKAGRWVAMRNGQEIGNGRTYYAALGMAEMSVIAGYSKGSTS